MIFETGDGPDRPFGPFRQMALNEVLLIDIFLQGPVDIGQERAVDIAVRSCIEGENAGAHRIRRNLFG